MRTTVLAVVALFAFLLVLLYTSDVAKCGSDTTCAHVWDDTSGFPY